MRKVSQNWIENQDKTLRDQGLLRLDFLSAHNNNAKANIIPMGSDSSKSNINEIKDISPYGAPNKNLAIPDVTGKEYLGNGVYRVYNSDGVTIDYNASNGYHTINGQPTVNSVIYYINEVTMGIQQGLTYYVKYYYVSGSSNSNYSFFNYRANTNPQVVTLAQVNGDSILIDYEPSIEKGIRLDAKIGHIYDNLTFKVQVEQGTQATDYEIPQPITGYVSSIPSGVNGEVATNLAAPDLTGKTDLGGGWYRLYNANAVTIDYNINNGHYRLNSTGKIGFGSSFVTFPQLEPLNEYTVKVNYINGYNSEPSAPPQIYLRYTDTTNFGLENVPFTKTFVLENKPYEWWYRTDSNNGTQIFTDYIFTIQLEKGSTVGAHQLPNFTPIEIDVEDYRSPLNGLTITWSENFGHAVDYSIEYNGEIYTYLNNTKKIVFVPIIVENTPDANFKIRVHKWSQGGVPIRIERVFVGLHLIYKQDKIFSFNKKKYNNVLGLELPQDQINFELSNLDRMFDPLWYNSYFKYLNEKTEIRAYSGFKYGTNGEEWIKQGTYYLTDWKAPNNSITATFTARDILNLLDADEMYSKDIPLTLDEYCDIILGRDYKGVDDYVPYDLPVNPDGTKKWNIRKNLAAPDLTGKTDLGGGVYRLYEQSGFTIDYDTNSSNYIYNGTGQPINIILGYFNVPEQSDYTMKLYYVSGTTSDMARPRISFTDRSNNQYIQGTYIDTYTRYIDISQQSFDTQPGTITYENFTFKLQIEKGSTATDYELPIENANIPVLKETVNKREALQLIAQSIGCHIKVNDNGNISFIRETYGKQIEVPKKILLTKPEFNLGAPVKKIIVSYSKYNPDPNELEVAKIDVSAGDIVELNHDTPYFNGHGTHTTGSATLQSTDMTWYRSFKAVIGGTGTGQLIVMREPVIKSSVNVIQDISSSGDTLTYENNLIDTQLKASRAIGKIWGELDNSRQVEFELRIDPRVDTFSVVSFPFRVLNLEQIEYMRVDELELTYNGAYKGKLKGVILSNYGGDLTPKTYTRRSDDFKSGEENLKWHLLSE